MPVVPVPPPQEVVAAAGRYVQALAHLPGKHVASGLAETALELVAPHRLYVLSLSAARAQHLSEAVFAGWQFLVESDGKVTATVEVNEDDLGSMAVARGPYGRATARAIDQLDDLADVAEDDYEFRVLRVNTLYAAAAWAAGKRNLFIPLAPSPPYLNAGEVYDEEGFLTALNHPSAQPFIAAF